MGISDGFGFALGVMLALAFITVGSALIDKVFTGSMSRDTTDPIKGARSGLGVRVDHATGVHYLVTLFGSITPRLNRDGTLWKEEDDAKEKLAREARAGQ